MTKLTPQHQFVENLACRKIQCFLSTIDEEGKYLDPVYQSNRRVAKSIASDYRDRFLIELIQNAYDAHRVEIRDGQIDITLDKGLGDYGTLFIANKGLPFNENNVKGICEFGLSQKPLETSIGNKGLGFRSVIQITNTPRIYSQCLNATDRDRFHGFHFRFAVSEDYSRRIKKISHRKLASRDLPEFHIPVWTNSQSDSVCDYAQAGFSTVIELPLRDEGSLNSVQREIDNLRQQRVPLLLFLNRVSSLTVRTVDNSKQVESEFEFTRSENNLQTENLELSRVCLDNAGQFLVARKSIAAGTMKDAILAGVESEELNEYWKKWSGEGEVSVAVRLDKEVESSRLYTFLPMGKQAAAPFPGYLHGSFSPSANRENLSARIQLNYMLLTEATMLAEKTIRHLISGSNSAIENDLTNEERATSVVDLLCWSDVDSLDGGEEFPKLLVNKLADNFGVGCFSDAPVVPCLPGQIVSRKLVCKPPTNVRRWPNGTEIFTDTAALTFAERTGLWPIWCILGHRIDTLDKFLCDHADGFKGEPCAEERGRLVGLIAKEFISNQRTLKQNWGDYYRDLPIFIGCDAECLAGMPILFCNDGMLHKAMTTESPKPDSSCPTRRRKPRKLAAVFSPPDPSRTSADDNLEIGPPKKLTERFAFLSSELPWHGDLSNVRKYLEENKLVGEFDRDAVLSHLSRTLEDERNKEVLRGGLRWAFELWRQPRSHGRPIKLQPRHRFKVPTLNNGYEFASEAIFSADWPDRTSGKLLQKFLDTAPKGLPELERVKERRLASVDHPAFRSKRIDEWVLFLTELGVKIGLTPEVKESRSKVFKAAKLTSFSFAEYYSIPNEFIETWSNDISTHTPNAVQLNYSTNYVIDGKLAWLPGQSDFERFSLECKESYALLVFRWLSDDSETFWSFNIRHEYFRNEEFREWPTPLMSFLRSARWISIDYRLNSVGNPICVRPCELWIREPSGDRFLNYLRRPSSSLRKYLNKASSDLIVPLKNYCGIRVFDDPSALLEQIEFLAQQFASNDFDRYYEQHLLNLYERTWQLLLNRFDKKPYEKEESAYPTKILVRRRKAYELMSMINEEEVQNEPVYVSDTNKHSDLNILEATGRPFVYFRDSDGTKMGLLFQALFKRRIKLLSKVKCDFLADGKHLKDCHATSVLEICPLLQTMVAVSMEKLSGTEAQQLPSDRTTILANIEKLNLINAMTLSFNLDDMDVSLTSDRINAFHFRLDNDRPVIAAELSTDRGWDLIDKIVPTICEAIGGHSGLEPHLRLLIAYLKQEVMPEEMGERSFNALKKFSNILRLSASELENASKLASAGVERNIRWIRVVLHYLFGICAVEEFDKKSEDAMEDIGVFEDALTDILEPSPISAASVIAACRSALSAGGVRDELNLEFGRFNASLDALNYECERHPELHRSRLVNFIRERENQIIDSLRASCSDRLDNMQPVDDYSIRRDSISNLVPKPVWLDDYKEPPENLLIQHVDAWLRIHDAPPLESHHSWLEPFDEVRSNNRRLIHEFVQKAIPLVRAWYTKHQPLESLPALVVSDEPTTEVFTKLDDSGVLDYRTLDNLSLLKWLDILGLWPKRMILSLDLEVHKLSQDDLTAETMKANEEKESRKRRARIFQFNSKDVDPNDADRHKLSDELQGCLSSTFLGTKLRSTPNLTEISESADSRRRDNGGRGGGGGVLRKVSRMPEEKSQLIGFLGECAVYHWLRNQLPKQDIDAAWRSKNCTHLTGRDGDDGLGYDFEVSYSKQIWQIEVKASLEDPKIFSMGETQIRAAKKAARYRSGLQFKIAYVSKLSNTKETIVELLPNPMTEEGGCFFKLQDEGIRYSFVRSSS